MPTLALALLAACTTPTTPTAAPPTDARTVDTSPNERDSGGVPPDYDTGDADDTADPDTASDTANDGSGGPTDTGEPPPPRHAGVISLETADAVFVGESTGDRAGFSPRGLGDLDGDGLDDIAVAADGADAGRGRVYLVRGVSTGEQALADVGVAIDGELVMDGFGHTVRPGGDPDGNGVPGLLVGAWHDDLAGADAGAAYLWYDAPTSDTTAYSADAIVTGAEGDWAGHAIGFVGDLDGDGIDELAVGAEYVGDDAGAVYLFTAAPRGQVLAETDADIVLRGAEGHELGHTVAAAGDLDGDGQGDLLVAAPKVPEPWTETGAAYAWFSPVATGGEPDATLPGLAEGDQAGHHVAAAGDVDGDGLGDIVVDAWYSDAAFLDAGAFYFVLGPVVGTMDLAAATSTRVGEAANDQFAIHVEANFDADADGIGDYLSGATFNDAAGAEAGALYLWYGPLAAGIGSAAGADAKWTGVHPGEQVGFGVAIAGDVDGDGRDDMLASATGHEGTGAAYLVLGR